MKFKIYITALLITTMTLFSCSNDGDNSDTYHYDGPGGTVSLTLSTNLDGEVNINNPANPLFQSIEPNMDVNTYTIEGREPGATEFVTLLKDISANSAIAITGLRPGTWTFKVLAKNPNEETIFGNIQDAQIEARLTTDLSMVLQPLDGEGMLSLSVYFPQSAISPTDPAPTLTGTMVNSIGESHTIAFTITKDDENNRYMGTFALNNIPNGHYRMVMTLKDGTTTLWTMNPTDVNILAEETTVGSITLSESVTTGTLVMDVSTDPNSHIDITLDGAQEFIEETSDITITAATSVAVDSYEWSLNGEILTGETTNTISIGKDLPVGKHNLSLFVKKDSVYASKEITFTVEALPPVNQGIEEWRKVYDTTSNGYGYHVTLDNDGYIYTSINGITKFDSDGNDIQTIPAPIVSDRPFVLSDDGYIYHPATSEGYYDIQKSNTEGNQIWLKKYLLWDFEPNSEIGGPNTIFNLATDSNGFIYTVGYGTHLIDHDNISSNKTGDGSDKDWWLAKFTPEGHIDEVSWNLFYDHGSQDDAATTIAIDSEDNIYVAGYLMVNGETDTPRWWIKKFNTSGSEDGLNWNKKYLDFCGEPKSITFDKDRNIYIAGTKWNSTDSSEYQWHIKKFSPEGIEDTTTWNLSVGDIDSQSDARSIAVDYSGNVYVAGSFNKNFSVKKFFPNGNEDTSWSKTSGTGCANSLVIAPDSSIYVSGYSLDLINEDSQTDIILIKYK